MKLHYHILDVFTDTAFTGNGLAVVLAADALSDEQMQSIAREFNLSETIFVHEPEDAAHTAKVRIFMPRGELPFAGHPTIGCAVLLASLKYKGGCSFETDILLEERAGLVPVRVRRIGGVPKGILTAPKLPKKSRDAPSPKSIAMGIGLEEKEIGFGSHTPGVIDAGSPILFVPVEGLSALANARVIEPHWSEMLRQASTFAAYIYAPAGEGGNSFRARLYAPAEGIAEDPATGMAAAALPGQIHHCENLADGEYRWQIAQGVEMGRPSSLTSEAEIKNGRIEVVRVGGQAVSIAQGILEF
jgi:trans-2,3-dihydro-3-hydroxyanthranilate isomerase